MLPGRSTASATTLQIPQDPSNTNSHQLPNLWSSTQSRMVHRPPHAPLATRTKWEAHPWMSPWLNGYRADAEAIRLDGFTYKELGVNEHYPHASNWAWTSRRSAHVFDLRSNELWSFEGFRESELWAVLLIWLRVNWSRKSGWRSGFEILDPLMVRSTLLKEKRSYAVVVVGIICTRYKGRVLSYNHSVLVW